jgi:hypothetical protein
VRRITTAVITLLIFGLGPMSLGCDESSAAVTSDAQTKVVVVSPVGAKGALKKGYSVGQHFDGSCNNTSLLRTGLRCFYRRQGKQQLTYQLQLCWALADKKTAACLPFPWSQQLVDVRTRALPRAIHYSGPPQYNLEEPIAVQLTSGLRCATSGGAPDVFNSMTVRYGCLGSTMWLLDPMIMSNPYWSFQSVLFNGDNTEGSAGPQVCVKTAYYAGS